MRIIIVVIILLLLFTTGCELNISTGDKTNQSPIAYIDSIIPEESAFGEIVSFIGHGTDSDGTIVAYRWNSDLDGELSVKPEFQVNSLSQGTHVVSFKVQDNNGTWSEEISRTIIITAQVVPVPVITLFTADPPVITAGQSSLLKWEVSNADTVNIEPDIGPVSATGTATVSPDMTTSYTITASNSHGTVFIEVTVTLSEPGDLNGAKAIVLHTVSGEDGALIKNDSSYTRQDVPCAGDDDINLARRAFLSFDISSIPQNAIINTKPHRLIPGLNHAAISTTVQFGYLKPAPGFQQWI